MRGNAHQSASNANHLTSNLATRRRNIGFWLTGAALVVLLGLTGRSASPFLPILVPWLGGAARRSGKPANVLFTGFVVLLISGLADGRGMTGALAALACVAAASLVYARLIPGVTQPAPLAKQPEVARPPSHMIEQALDGVRAGLLAGRTILWQTDEPNEHAQPWIVRGGVFGPAITLSGDVLGVAARLGMSVRAERLPPWAEPSSQTCAVAPVGAGVLLSLEFDRSAELPTIDDLERAAAYLAAFLELEQARNASLDEHRRMDRLVAVLRQLPAEIEPYSLAQRLAEAGLHLAAADGAAVAEWDGEAGRVIALLGMTDGIAMGTTFTGNESDSALAARAGSSIVRVPRPRDSLPVIGKNERLQARPRALAAIPLTRAGRVVGTLTVWSASARLDEPGLEMLETLAPYAGMQLSHAHEFDQLRERAHHDPLTGLLNRQAFNARLAAENARFQRNQRPYALLLLDVDHFKQVNDRYGHPAGDAVLRSVGATVAGSLREVDHAARYGGEEFAILLPETDLAAALLIAERIRARLASVETETPGGRITVTASLGVSACPECAHDPEVLVRSADAALYRSKREGRDQVSAASVHQAQSRIDVKP